MTRYLPTSLLCVIFLAGSAPAATLDFSFTSSLRYGQPGAPVTFGGTLTNTGATPVFVNGDGFTFGLPLDDLPFFLNVPQIMAPGESITAPLFTVNIPPATALGLYTGTFSILGGDTASDFEVLADSPFGVEVVPEPASWLFAMPALGVFMCRRFRCER